MPDMIENNGQFQIKEQVPKVARPFLVIAGLFPWLAPYELLIKPGWTGFSVIILFSIIVSLGAMAVSLSFLTAAFFGLDQVLTINVEERTLTHAFKTAVTPLLKRRYNFSDVTQVEIHTHDWSDGPSTHRLEILLPHNQKISIGSFVTMEEARRVQNQIENWIS